MREIKEVYALAGEGISKALVDAGDSASSAPLSILSAQLMQAQQAIADSIEKETIDGVHNVNGLYAAANETYIVSAIGSANAFGVMTGEGVRSLMVAIDTRVVEALINQQWQDEYTFSSRIWRASGDFNEQIKRLITSGVAQGRHIFDIAKDIEGYVAKGADALGKGYKSAKYGEVVAKKVDWQALRLVRSEIASAQQTASVEYGLANPGCAQEFNWVLTPGREHWDCKCASLAAGSPYPADKVPTYPHSNCMCRVEPVLRPRAEFIADLERWAQGERVDYLDNWKKNYYS
jgi:hypothetical protein